MAKNFSVHPIGVRKRRQENKMDKIIKHKIAGIPANYAKLAFGQQIDLMPILKEFKEKAKNICLSQKKTKYSKAIKEAIDLYNVDEYYCAFNCTTEYKDDSFEFWYTTKS